MKKLLVIATAALLTSAPLALAQSNGADPRDPRIPEYNKTNPSVPESGSSDRAVESGRSATDAAPSTKHQPMHQTETEKLQEKKSVQPAAPGRERTGNSQGNSSNTY